MINSPNEFDDFLRIKQFRCIHIMSKNLYENEKDRRKHGAVERERSK